MSDMPTPTLAPISEDEIARMVRELVATGQCVLSIAPGRLTGHGVVTTLYRREDLFTEMSKPLTHEETSMLRDDADE